MSYLQINHKFNESLTIMHFVHVYRPCAEKGERWSYDISSWSRNAFCHVSLRRWL